MSERRFNIYAPLQDFFWSGENFQLAPSLRIRRYREAPDLSGLRKSIAEDEWDRVLSADHWLTFAWTDSDALLPGEIAYLI